MNHAELRDPIKHCFFATWPGLAVQNFNKRLPKSTATAKGHLDQQRKNLRSTKTKAPVPHVTLGPKESPTDVHPPTSELRSHFVYAEACTVTGQVYTDQPGKFLVSSTSGNQDLLVLYDYDSNAILAEPMKSKSGPEIVRAYKTLHAQLVNRGLKPQLQKLDNEASKALQDYMHSENIDFQLTPTGSHRRNAAERAIRTFKNHVIANLCGTDPDFPLAIWDLILPQMLLTLNLLRGSRLNPRLSAYAQLT